MPLIYKTREFVRHHMYRQRPNLGDQVTGGPAESDSTFVMVCRAGFNANQLGSNGSIRLGFCHGFAQTGIRYQLMSVFDIARQLPKVRNPFVFLSVYDYIDLSSASLRTLKKFPHFVWVNPWLPDLDSLLSERGLPVSGVAGLDVPPQVAARVLASNVDFVFAPVPPSCLRFYSMWREKGCRVESVPLACDTERYYPNPSDDRFSEVEMAFVGLYRGYKDIQYEKYLRPYEAILRVYGFGPKWPYKGYAGPIAHEDEKILYQNSRVCPALDEPHAELTGDIVERPFKVLGSGGLAVTDVVPVYRELFEPEELLVSGSVQEYHDMVKRALTDDDFNQSYRRKGYDAIVKRHSYAHRAMAILKLLNML